MKSSSLEATHCSHSSSDGKGLRGRPKNVIPSYRRHRATGQAVVSIDGKDHYLGKFGSDESRIEYGKLIAKFASGLPIDPIAKSSAACEDSGPSVNEVCLSFWTHAEKHYLKNGESTSELHCYKICLRVVRSLYGLIPAKDFGPLALKAVRAKMVDGDLHALDSEGKPSPRAPWARKTVNRMVARIRQVFKHAVENEMIDVDVLTRLQTVAPLLAGRTEARDNPPRTAVDQDRIDAVRQRVRPIVKDLIDLQLLNGSRPGELLCLTTAMIDRSGEIWSAKLGDHKCSHLGKERTLYFGPQAQLILTKYLSADPDKRLFDIERTSYCRAITRACDKAKVDRWTPHWLRHTFCTQVREAHGLDAAQALAGHSKANMTDEYSRNMAKLATKTAAEVG